MSWYEALDQWTADYLPDITYEHDAPLSRHTSFRIGGPARRMAFPKDGSQMVLLIEAARSCDARPLVIGNGTNLLFPDEGVDRLVVNTRDMSGVTLDAGQQHQLWIPPGMAHGFLALSDTVHLHYKCTDFYHPRDEGSLRWDDPDIGIAWPLSLIHI